MTRSVQFAISDQAKRKIVSLIEEYKAKSGKEVAIPAVVWLDSNLNSLLKESQPTIGMYDDRAEIDEESILVIDGMEIVFTPTQDDQAHFEGMTLDYENPTDRFRLIRT